jgi:CHAD domain-containing protein
VRTAHDEDPIRRHQVRIRLKHLQYAMETWSLVVPAALDSARAAERLQSRLGRSHDATEAATALASNVMSHRELRPLITEAVVHLNDLAEDAARGWRREVHVVKGFVAVALA